MGLPGVMVREANFIPTFDKYVDSACGGIQLHVFDASRFRALRCALTVISEVRRLYPSQFGWRLPSTTGTYYFDLLTGSNVTRLAVDRGDSVDDIVDMWEADPAFAEFRERRGRHLLYTSSHAWEISV